MLIFWTVWMWRHLRRLTRGLIGKMKERVTDQRQRLNEGPKKCLCFAVYQYDSLALVRAWFLSKKSRKVTQVQSWPKKFVLGCVIPPAGVVARSRNLGHTFLAHSVHNYTLASVYARIHSLTNEANFVFDGVWTPRVTHTNEQLPLPISSRLSNSFGPSCSNYIRISRMQTATIVLVYRVG